MSMDREKILRRFEAWLDGALASEEPPQGIAADILSSLGMESEGSINGRYDLYSMWAAVTALTQEVKLQGRTFKLLSDTLAPVADLSRELPDVQREAEERARREILDVLLDLRDRLGRGLDAARASQATMRESLPAGRMERLARWLGYHKTLSQAAEAVAAIEEGFAMTLGRLDEVLAQFDVQEIACQGEAFDPSIMRAVDLEETDRLPEGTVVDVYRKGYEWKGEVYRPAQVRVTRKPVAAALGEQTK